MTPDRAEPVDVALDLARRFDRLGIGYFVVGSISSSFWGLARTTLDADIVVDLDESNVRPLIAALQDDDYADVPGSVVRVPWS